MLACILGVPSFAIVTARWSVALCSVQKHKKYRYSTEEVCLESFNWKLDPAGYEHQRRVSSQMVEQSHYVVLFLGPI